MDTEIDPCSLPLHYNYSKYLFYSSFLLGFSSLICFAFGDYYNFLVLFILFLSSIKFWRKPDYGITRDIDMFLCKCLTVYLGWNSIFYYTDHTREICFMCFICCLFFYATELILYAYKSKYWIIFHMAIHFYVAFFTPFALYIL
jgi:hypothetical protein